MLPLPIRLQAIAARKRDESAQAAQLEIERRLTRLSASEGFYLRAKPTGYDLGPDDDPDGILSTGRK
jgi:hypothetical protein